MPPRTAVPVACARCARLSRQRLSARPISTTRPSKAPPSSAERDTPGPSSKGDTADSSKQEDPDSGEPGALTRRLEAATEDALLSRSGRHAINEAGFSPELKARLLAKVSAANPSTPIPERNIAPGAGQGTRHHASAQPWTGTETTEDAVLRMLDDAKPRLPRDLRGPPVQPPVLKKRVDGPARAAGARERAESYRGGGLSEKERGQLKSEFADRFGPGVRSMPSLTGLASLANERCATDLVAFLCSLRHVLTGPAGSRRLSQGASSRFAPSRENVVTSASANWQKQEHPPRSRPRARHPLRQPLHRHSKLSLSLSLGLYRDLKSTNDPRPSTS